jgi:putative transposase
LFKKKPDLKRGLWGGEFWTDGYYVATVGERADWGIVERYVKNQGKPKEELRQLAFF